MLSDKILSESYGVSDKLLKLAEQADKDLSGVFEKAAEVTSYNQLRVLAAMRDNRLSETHFAGSTGYGYNDGGRDALEKIYSDVFAQPSALVRPQMISGTHAISTALFGILRPGDEMLAVTGKPYDTLLKVVGVNPARGSLMEHGIIYNEVPLTADGNIDFSAIKNAINPKTKVAAIQRSKGYAWRHSFTVDEINGLIDYIKSINKDIICFVDNCYGEFTDVSEPKGDIMAGSLIKNPGGGLAPVGGYIVGKEELVYAAACRLNTPGAGGEVGPTLGFTSAFLQGFFNAPQVVQGALKGAVFLSWMFDKLGYEQLPGPFEKRSDIVQAAKLKEPAALEAFCRGIQKAAPVDSFVTPEAWEMPGYDCKIIMAAGAFVQGSSIELSADAPMREPYIVYFQGGLNYDHSRAGALIGINEMFK